MMNFDDAFESFLIIRQSLKPLRLTKWQLSKLFIAQVYRQTSPSVLLPACIIVSLLCYSLWQHRLDFQQIVEEGARKYPDSPYIIKTQGLPYVVFPSSSFDEVKRLPSSVASAQEFFIKIYSGTWTTAGEETTALLRTIGIDLARGIPAKIHSRQEDCKQVIGSTIGHCPQWKELELFWVILKIVAQTNACSLLGRGLGTEPKWVKLVERFPMTVLAGAFAMSALPRWIQPLLAPFIFAPTIKTKWDMKRILAPIIKADMEEYLNSSDKKGLLQLKSDGKVPFTAWLMSRYKPEEATMDQLVKDYVITSFESTPSTAATLYCTLAELAAKPELMDVLREELAEVMKDGKLPETHLGELRKMDSVMREASRTNPFSLLVLYRLLQKPVKLSIGPTIPKGSIICVDAHHIHGSPKLWENPETYNGMRFHELRKQPGNENRYQFASLGSDAPGWGDGSMACPGRMFANNTIKIALSHILLNYDIKFRDGEGKPSRTSLPNGSQSPDLKAKFLFRSRT
ncbi:MAG: hypothetical protein M1839_002859 [Geoglossum umbratile]|nr:MAG: hypothetical protein M1839_002859 [Geoglossum umbratile]